MKKAPTSFICKKCGKKVGLTYKSCPKCDNEDLINKIKHMSRWKRKSK